MNKNLSGSAVFLQMDFPWVVMKTFVFFQRKRMWEGRGSSQASEEIGALPCTATSPWESRASSGGDGMECLTHWLK